MSALRADLHIHTCLSPCADDDLTPAAAAGLAKLAGADVIAITDHNSARNLPAAQIACEAYGLRLLPGIEANTQEEIHLLCYFGRVETALAFSRELDAFLPPFPYDPSIWGRQLVMDENDQILDEVPKLLTGALTLSLEQTASLCRSMGGIPVPAHVDADSYSLFSVLGGWPLDVNFDLMEVKNPAKFSLLVEKGFFPADKPLLLSSDAHRMEDVACRMCEVEEESPLFRLLNNN